MFHSDLFSKDFPFEETYIYFDLQRETRHGLGNWGLSPVLKIF